MDGPAGQGDVAAERRALAEGAGVVALPHRTLLVVTGEDRIEFLQGMLTNEVAGLASGEACPALLLTVQGRVTSDVDVLRLDDAVWLVVATAATADVVAALEKLIVADDVVVSPEPDWTMLGLLGPRGAGLLADGAVPEPWRHVVATVAGVEVRALRGAPVAAGDVTLFVPREQASRVHDALVARGATPCSAAALEAHRIALGVPRMGVDMDADTLAIELPLEARISDRKGCYLGQEVVARGTSRGRVQRRLRGLVFEGPPPSPGAALLAEGGKPVGVVTSVARPPAVPTAIGLGLVRREHWEAGARLVVAEAVPGTARVADPPLA